MKKWAKNITLVIVSIVIAGGLMYFVLKNFEGGLNDIKNIFVRADYFWVAISAFFGILGYWFRAIRWNLLLEPMNFEISNYNALWSISFGYLMNLLIPRSGEIARATVLQSVEKVPAVNSFGTIIIERIIDLAFMCLFLGLTVIFNYSALFSFFDLIGAYSSNPEKKYTFYYIVIVVFLLLMILYFVFRKYINNHPFTKKIKHFIVGFVEGLISVFKLKQRKKFILLSFALWGSYFFAAYFITKALPETSDIQITDGFYLLSVGTLGMLVPASGGIGAFHLAMQYGIAALFLSLGKSSSDGENAGIYYGFLSHTTQTVIMLVMGVISIFMLLKNRKLLKNI